MFQLIYRLMFNLAVPYIQTDKLVGWLWLAGKHIKLKYYLALTKLKFIKNFSLNESFTEQCQLKLSIFLTNL